MAEKYIFNLNSEILVKLPEKAYGVLMEYESDFTDGCRYSIEYWKSKVDEQGYTKFQAWEFFQIFGEELYGGNWEDYSIVLQAKDLQAFEEAKAENVWKELNMKNNIFWINAPAGLNCSATMPNGVKLIVRQVNSGLFWWHAGYAQGYSPTKQEAMRKAEKSYEDIYGE